MLAETAKISLSAASAAGFKICICTFREQNDKMQYLICTSAACQIKPQPNLIVSQHSSTQTQSDDSRSMSSVQDALVWSNTPTRPMCRGGCCQQVGEWRPSKSSWQPVTTRIRQSSTYTLRPSPIGELLHQPQRHTTETQ